jgi:hypothetical protein
VNLLSSENRRMAAALWYLQSTSFVGAAKLRLKRLKQPKYLIGSLLFLAYLGTFFGSQVFGARPLVHWGPRGMDTMNSLFALLCFGWALIAWAVPSGRATLRFTEAEIAFLFPAPLSRVGLINFSLLRAQQVEDMRGGKWPWRKGNRTANNAPFRLAERGPPAMAFLWSGLIGAGGGFWRPRNLVLIVLATVLVLLGIAASPWAPVLKMVGAVALSICLGSVLFGTMLVQGRLRQVLELLDIYKASPLPGRQIALGQLLTPAALVAMAQWYLLVVVALCTVLSGKTDIGNFAFGWSALFGVALLGPLLCTLLMCFPFAWVLWFPAWAASLGTRGGGFEAAGQRMIFSFVYIVASAVSLLPALLLGGLVAWACSLMGAPTALGLLIVAVVAAIVLVVELAAIVHVLGGRIDRFDVSTELR